MAVLPIGIGSATNGGYQIERSLRFNSADTTYLNRTPASAGNRKTWTWSGWIKRSSTTQTFVGIFQAGTSTSAQGLAIGDTTTANIIAFYYTNNDLALRSTQVLRDVSAWYHIVVALDTTQATASNRLRIYLNGSEITTWTTDNRATAFSQNSDQSINNNIQHIIGNYSGGILSSYSPNGYMTEINFVDSPVLVGSTTNASTTVTLTTGTTANIGIGWNVGGTNIPSGATVSSITNSTQFVISSAATATGSSISIGVAPPVSAFGETDSATGVWKPKAYTGTYGTNGFYLKFADNSGTTSTTLGKDSSGNGNNWTPNNFSVTAGVGNDSLVDSPTSYGTDTGVGGEVRGNYCTWNPLDKNTNVTINNGNLDAIYTGSADVYGCFSTFSVSSGKWYAEFTATGLGGANYPLIGIRRSSSYQANFLPETYVDLKAGTSTNRGSAGPTFTAFVDGDVLGIAFNADSGEIFFSKNGTFLNSGDPVAGTGEFFSGLTDGPFKFGIGTFSSRTAIANFGQRPFEKWNGSAYVANTAPSGFKALCTQNFTTPTIGATSTTQANDYFNTVIYTGTSASTQAVTGAGFQPDFVWVKSRSLGVGSLVYDAVRGAGSSKALQSNSTDPEGLGVNVTAASSRGYISSFDSDGFTAADGTTSGQYSKANTSTYVAWNWNAGGSNQTISVGQYATSPANVPSIASTVRANTTSGFSIVTYTGNGTSGATIGHGLGAVPSFYIVKNRGSANKDWECYHISLGNTNRIRLNVNAAADTGGTMWANTTPTSTVFSVGVDADVNASTNTYVAYCFAPVAGYSAFGSYTGNGSATDGTFVYLGFRPRFLMIKSTSAGTSWVMMDSVRNTYNLADTSLYADSFNSETTIGTVNDIDFLSNGFKLRNNTGFVNASQTYIYAAFAEHPFKYSLGR